MVTVFPGSRGAEQDRDRPGRDREIDSVEDAIATEALHHVDQLDGGPRLSVDLHAPSLGALPSTADAHRRAARDPEARVLDRVLSAEDAGGSRAAVRDRPGAEAARPGLRLGDLRGRRRDPRRHGRDRRADQVGARDRGDGAPELRRRDARRARGDPRPVRGDRDRERPRAARRSAPRRGRVHSTPRTGSRAPPSSPASSPTATSSRSAAPASRRSTRRPRASTPTSTT